MKYPPGDKAYQLLGTYNLPQEIMLHSVEVAANAVVIAKQLRAAGTHIDEDLVHVGGLLHDIGRHKFLVQNGCTYDRDFHEVETWKLLAELEYPHLGNMLRRHSLGGLTVEETASLGYPEPADLMPNTLPAKVVCIADKIRTTQCITTLAQKIQDYRTNQRLHQRYFAKMPGLLDVTIGRVTAIWHELNALGMTYR